MLAEHLKAQKAADHVVAAAKEFVCDACVESVGRKHQRPAKFYDARDFNDLIGMDGFYWSGTRGFRVHVFHCIDEASFFTWAEDAKLAILIESLKLGRNFGHHGLETLFKCTLIRPENSYLRNGKI